MSKSTLGYYELMAKQLGQNYVAGATPTANQIIQNNKSKTPAVDSDKGKGAGGNDKTNLTYGAYASAVDQQNNLLKQQQALMEKQRRAAMEATVNANNQAADSSLKEAYVANMMAKKNMPQQLKAMGISGGATETTLADIQNTYMNNRFGIEANRNNANQQARLAYDNGVMGDYSNYLTKAYELQGSIADKAISSSSKSKTENGTAVDGYTSTAVNNAMDDFDGYSVMQVKLGNNTYTIPQLINTLASQGMSDAQIEAFLNAQGIK